MNQVTLRNMQQSSLHSDDVSNASTDSGDPHELKLLCSNKASKQTNFKAKSSLCRNYNLKGYCLYGPKCQFAHGASELRCNSNDFMSYKTRPCHTFSKKDFCVYGGRCNFVHEGNQHKSKDGDGLNGYRQIVYRNRAGGSSRLIQMISL